MTNAEAIQFLDNIKHAEAGRAIGSEGFYAELLGYHIQALNMAIKALKQQTCEDAVSRKAVLGLFAQNADAVRPYSKTWEEVKALPSVNPQPKTGHWIMPVQDDGMSDPIYYQVRCSKCGFDLDPQTWHQELHQYGADKFCPKCGAKMVEPQESEVSE